MMFFSFMHETENKSEALTHKLVGDGFSVVIEDLRSQVQLAFPQPEVAQLLTPHGFKSLFALIGR